MKILLACLMCVLAPAAFSAADQGVAFGVPVAKLTDQPDDWFKTQRGRETCDNIVSWQNDNGGWWKSYDASKPRPPKVATRPNSGPAGDDDSVWHKTSTIDNNATYSELRILARAARILDDQKYKDAFNRGLHYLFDAQYPNGGWPQRYPLQENYGRHITFNDNAMLGVMDLMRDVADQKPDFTFVSEADRTHAKEAFDKGIDCILKCQVKINGKLTVWCQQHDEVTLAPTNARAYELPSLTAGESSGLTLLLMSLEKPDQRIRDAVDAAVAWYKDSEIHGKRLERFQGPDGPDAHLVDDPNSPPLWARFYDLETGKPFVCGRDGIKRDKLADIPRERRGGYQWYGYWGNKVLEEYPKWQQRTGTKKD